MLPLTPTKLGRYEIVDEIGKGAMGVVYLARDPLIGRLVALKTFRIGYSVRDQELEQFRARFIREAQSAGILSHPNIVTIHDVVEESEEGLAFIAMEYVRGTNLKALLQGDQPLSLPFVVDVIAQVADALDYAHSHRVIHRDVKPANILITADNRVKITDFGIARLDTSNLTQEGQLLGTPNYMAPEQIQGKDVDHRADLFALGVVLYEMLTRHKPFQGENLTVVSHRIVYDHFTPPREYLREMPPGIEPVLNRALEKDPARRYQRAKEMVDELRRLAGSLSGEDLNETQSLATIAPALAPPPGASGTDTSGSRTPPPLSGSSIGSMSSLGSSLSVPPPLPVAAKPPKPPKPPRSGPLVSPRRVAVAGSAAAFLILLLGAAVLLWLSWTTPAKGRDAKEDAERSQVISQRQAQATQPPGGATQADDLQSQKITHLKDGEAALADHRWDEAAAAANALLQLDPADPNAQVILAAVRDGQAKARTAALNPRTPRKGQPEIVANPSPVEPMPSAPESRPAEPVSQIATVRITFDSDLDGTTARVMLGKDNVFQEAFRERGVFSRGEKGGHREKSVQLAAGNAELKVYMTTPGKPATVQTLKGNFPGGQSRRLEIRITASGNPYANLN
jgi:serine/threonine-protein kinase